MLDTTLHFSIWMHEQKPHFKQFIFINKYLEGKNKNNLQDNQPINPTLYIPEFWAKKIIILSSDIDTWFKIL